MKPIIIILACLLSMNAMAQKKDNGFTQIKGSGPHSITLSQLDSLNRSSYLSASGTALYFHSWNGPEMKTESWIITGGDGKEAMKIVLPDSLGIVRGYINRKKIVWTSDSTFTIKTK